MVDHFGLVFKDLPPWIAKWKANGVEIEQNQNPLQGYVHAPDGMDHIHFRPVDAAAIQAWYARTFGGKPGWIDCDFFPGANFSPSMRS